MASKSDPYQPPNNDGLEQPSSLTVWRALAFAIVLMSVTPFAMTVRVLIAHYIGLSANPSTSYRPVVVFVPLYWSFIAALVCLPLFLIVSKFGKSDDTAVASCGVFFPAISLPLSMFGPLVICWLTGSSLGS